MEYDEDKVDDATLALMYLVAWRQKKNFPWSAWKSFDWETMNRLHEKGLISDPRNKNKSATMSDEAFEKSERLFNQLFGKEK